MIFCYALLLIELFYLTVISILDGQRFVFVGGAHDWKESTDRHALFPSSSLSIEKKFSPRLDDY